MDANETARRQAARAILAQWIRLMSSYPREMVRTHGRESIKEWIVACAADASVMHDNCDANLIFDAVLETRGLSDEWNEVTDLLPEVAAEIVRAWEGA